MSNELLVSFDDDILRLPTCLAVHAQLRSNLTKFTTEDYVKYIRESCLSNICGVVRKTETEINVLAVAVYHHHLTTFDTVRFEIDDLIVDKNQRNRGLGQRILNYLIENAKLCNASQILVHCGLTNTDAHRFFFRFGLTITLFEFYIENNLLLKSNEQIQIVDITDLTEEENEQFLVRSHHIFRQLRPHLSDEKDKFIEQIRTICRTGPARMIIALNKEKSELFGLAIYRISHNTNYSTYIYCDDLVTNENSRSLGVGRCLINYMKNQAKLFNINHLTLDSGCQRGRAHKFYYREGFIINQIGFNMKIE